MRWFEGEGKKEPRPLIIKMVEEDKEEKKQIGNVLRIGDLEIGSTTSTLKELTATAKNVLKNKEISNYLNLNFPKKRFLGVE